MNDYIKLDVNKMCMLILCEYLLHTEKYEHSKWVKF
jgi:hypothetical protein